MEFSSEHAIGLSKSETLLIQAFRELIYDYQVRPFPDNHSESHRFPLLASEYLFEYRQLCQVASPYVTEHSTSLCALFGIAKRLCENNIPGNFVECGFANSLSTIVLAYVIKRYSRMPRLLYVLPPPTGSSKSTPASDGLDQELPDEVAQNICAKLEVSAMMRTTRVEYQALVKHSFSLMGMIAFLHSNDMFRGFCFEQLSCLEHQLVGQGFVQVDGRCSQDVCWEYAHRMRCSREADVTFHSSGDNFTWFYIPDVRTENPLILKSAVESFKRDDEELMPLVSQMSPNERFQLHYLLSTTPLGCKNMVRFVEIGSYSGHSLLLSYLALKRRFRNVQCIAVEPYGTSQFYESIQRYRGDIIHLKMFSDEAAPLLQRWFKRDNVQPSFIFIDANHRYEHVHRDITHYLPLLDQDGLMIFHDYLPPLDDQNREAILVHHAGKEPGVRQACGELIEATNEYQALDPPLLYPDDLTQTQAQLPIILGVRSTLRVYRGLRKI